MENYFAGFTIPRKKFKKPLKNTGIVAWLCVIAVKGRKKSL